jgi:hypothetical protein
MPFADPLIWKAVGFSTTAALFVLGTTWWLYRSSLTPPVAVPTPPSTRVAGWLAALLGLSGLLLVIGGLWDGSMHIETGKIPAGADFLWPPHLVIYGGFLLAFSVAAVALILVTIPSWRSGGRDPRRWVRNHPFLGAVALASLYVLLALPGDALWHEIGGRDLTAWSPPHVMLGLMQAAVLGSAVGLLVHARAAMRRVGWANTAITVLLALILTLMHLIGVLDWEWSVKGPHEGRPLWFYPLVGGGLAFFILMLGKQVVRYRWMATAIALLYYVIRLSIMLGLELTGHVTPAFPLAFLLGAVLLDGMPWHRVKPRRWHLLGPPVAFTAGYTLLVFPILTYRTDLAPFDTIDIILATALLLLTSVALLPAANLADRQLLGPAHALPRVPSARREVPLRNRD